MANIAFNDAVARQKVNENFPDNAQELITAADAREVMHAVLDTQRDTLNDYAGYVESIVGEYPERFSSIATTLSVDGLNGNDNNTGSSSAKLKTLARAAEIVNGRFTHVEIYLFNTVEVDLADVLFFVPYLTLWIQSGATLRFRKRTGLTDTNSVVVGEGHWRLIQYGSSLVVRNNGTLEVEAHAGSTGAGDPFYYQSHQGAMALANNSAKGQSGYNPAVYHDEQQSIALSSWGTITVGANATLFAAGTNGHAGYGSRQVRYRRSVFSGSFTLGAGGYEHYGLDDTLPGTDAVTIYLHATSGNDGWMIGNEQARPLKTLRQAAANVRGRYAKVRFQLLSNVEVTEDIDLTTVDDLEIVLGGYQLYHRRKTVNGKEGTFALFGMKNVLLNGTGSGSEVRVEALSAAPSDADYTTSTDFCYNQGAYRLGSSQFGGYLTGRLVNAARVNVGNYATLVAAHGTGIYPVANGIEYLEADAQIAQYITLGTRAFLARRAKHMVFYRSAMAQNEQFYTILSGADHALLSGSYELTSYVKLTGHGGTMNGSIWTCRFAWFAGPVNEYHENYKSMDRMSHNTNGKGLQVRTLQQTGNTYNQTLDFKLQGNESLTSAYTFRFEVRRLSYEPNQTA